MCVVCVCVVYGTQHTFVADRHGLLLPSLRFIGYTEDIATELPLLVHHYFGASRAQAVRKQITSGQLHLRSRSSAQYMHANVSKRLVVARLSSTVLEGIRSFYAADACLLAHAGVTTGQPTGQPGTPRHSSSGESPTVGDRSSPPSLAQRGSGAHRRSVKR